MKESEKKTVDQIQEENLQLRNRIENLERRIERSEWLESIGILAGGVAHDFNNILTGLLGNLSLAKEVTKPEDPAYHFLAEGEREAFRAKVLTRQLLVLPSEGRKPIKEKISIAQLLRETVQITLSGSTYACDFDVADDLWQVEVDPGQISHVINSLIFNAIQASPESGTIAVRGTNYIVKEGSNLPLKPGNYVEINCEDQGVGIPEKLIPKIFNPHFTTKDHSVGIGLSTVSEILKAHDGTIQVESEEGRGSVFTFFIPALEAKEEPRKMAEEKPLGKFKGKIMVMDDEESIRLFLTEALGLLGYDVVLVANGEEAIEAYKSSQKQDPFDVVILDLTIRGGMGGRETIKKLKDEIDPQVKAVVMSGFSNDPIILKYQQYGFKGYLAKPYRLQILSKVIQDVMKG